MLPPVYEAVAVRAVRRAVADPINSALASTQFIGIELATR
jgi:hypothetical protein